MSVMISIHPKYCELIALGKKTIEVRKTRPKIPAPFKCYIYCTKPKMITKYVFKPEDYPEYMRPEKPVFCKVPDASSPFCSEVNGNSKVIGEFVCDNIDTYDDDTIFSFRYEDYARWNDFDLNRACIHPEDFQNYADGKWLYGWHISDLKIYDEPKELREFGKVCKYRNFDGSCQYAGSIANMNRPPQSWCYVEEQKLYVENEEMI